MYWKLIKQEKDITNEIHVNVTVSTGTKNSPLSVVPETHDVTTVHQMNHSKSVEFSFLSSPFCPD